MKLRSINLDKLTSIDKVKESVHGLLMQQKLLSIAYEKGYDTTSYVIDTFKKLADYIYLNYKRNEIVDQVAIPDSELYKFTMTILGITRPKMKWMFRRLFFRIGSRLIL